MKIYYLCGMEQRKKKIEDPLKLLLPSVIYDYFELVHTEVSDIDVHLFLEEQYMPPQAVGYESKGFTEHSVIQDFPLRGKPVYLHVRRRKWLEKLPRLLSACISMRQPSLPVMLSMPSWTAS